MKLTRISLILAGMVALAACGGNGEEQTKSDAPERIVCLSKQYNEIIFTLGAQKDIVAVDLSSVYPSELKKVTKVGYHRALSAEAILSQEPTLIIHDNNIGPDYVIDQLEQLNIPMKSFKTETKDIASTKRLIKEMGVYFGKEKKAKLLCDQLDKEMSQALEDSKKFTQKTKVLIIHYGQAKNHYLVVTNKSTAAQMIQWAGGELSVKGDKGMRQLSAEVVAASDPDVILMTDFGYDRLGSLDKIKELPGVKTTKAAINNRIYRVNEYDLIYLGPRTGVNTQKLQRLLHPKD